MLELAIVGSIQQHTGVMTGLEPQHRVILDGAALQFVPGVEEVLDPRGRPATVSVQYRMERGNNGRNHSIAPMLAGEGRRLTEDSDCSGHPSPRQPQERQTACSAHPPAKAASG